MIEQARTFRMPSAPRGRGGFTLAEMIVVLAVIGILSSIMLPRLDTLKYRVNANARTLVSTLNYSQRLAVSLQHDVRVAFDVGGRRLRVHEDANNNNVIDPGERVSFVPLEEGIAFGRGTAAALPFGGANIALTRTQDGMPVLIFRRDGTASENGGFYLNTTRGLTAGLATDTRALEIVRSPGKIVYWTNASGSWKQGN